MSQPGARGRIREALAYHRSRHAPERLSRLGRSSRRCGRGGMGVCRVGDAMRMGVTVPKPGALLKAGQAERRRLQRVNQQAVHKAGTTAHKVTQFTIQQAGLGNLSKAVKVKTSLREGSSNPDFAWAAIYASGGDESRSGQALIAYTQGAVIKPVKGEWLWHTASALKRIIGFGRDRARMTPALYNKRGYNKTLGELQFSQIGPNRAVLRIYGVDLKRKSGLAVPRSKRRSKARISRTVVVAFIGTRNQIRVKRYDQNKITKFYSDQVPRFIAEAQKAGI
jgi:hypothetical protein